MLDRSRNVTKPAAQAVDKGSFISIKDCEGWGKKDTVNQGPGNTWRSLDLSGTSCLRHSHKAWRPHLGRGQLQSVNLLLSGKSVYSVLMGV